MAPRRAQQTVARNVLFWIAATGNTVQSVARATGTPIAKFSSSPCTDEWTFAEMAAVGGFLHVRADLFMKGVPA